jgi:hypothetical protein
MDGGWHASGRRWRVAAHIRSSSGQDEIASRARVTPPGTADHPQCYVPACRFAVQSGSGRPARSAPPTDHKHYAHPVLTTRVAGKSPAAQASVQAG